MLRVHSDHAVSLVQSALVPVSCCSWLSKLEPRADYADTWTFRINECTEQDARVISFGVQDRRRCPSKLRCSSCQPLRRAARSRSLKAVEKGRLVLRPERVLPVQAHLAMITCARIVAGASGSHTQISQHYTRVWLALVCKRQRLPIPIARRALIAWALQRTARLSDTSAKTVLTAHSPTWS